MDARGETPGTFRFSTMSRWEAEIFARSDDPGTELMELFPKIESMGHRAHMRIAGLYAQMGRGSLGSARRHFALALTEADLNVLSFRDQDWHLAEQFADLCGVLSYCLGEVCEAMGNTREARVHFERGLRHLNAHCAMKLALYEKLDGNFDLALFLLTSLEESDDPDLPYLLGDYFHARGNFARAHDHFSLASTRGHRLAERRLLALGSHRQSDADPGVEEIHPLGDGWELFIEHMNGDIILMRGDLRMDELAVSSDLLVPPSATEDRPKDPFERVYDHRSSVDRLKKNSFAFRDDRRSGVIQVRTAPYEENQTVAVTIDLASGAVTTMWFSRLRDALKELRVEPGSIIRTP